VLLPVCHAAFDAINPPSGAAMISISMDDADGSTLKEFLEAKLVELRREISHTDSPRFRETLYQLEGVLQRTIAQLP
jgi:hypothetical protein